jgi:YggT family protein
MTTGPVTLLLTIFLFVLLLHVIFSWVPRPPEPILPFVLGVRRVVEPLAAPLRRVIPPLRLGGVGLDLSIIVLFIAVRILMSITSRLGI